MKNSDLKILWGKSAGRCAICKQNLILLTNDIVIGEMAHVIANSPKGPRGNGQKGEDNYQNLILLCPTHHTEIDKNPSDWDVNKLNRIKTEHEEWVTKKLDSGEIDNIPFDEIIKFNKEVKKQRILHNLLWMNWGNARYLYAIQQEENYDWLRYHSDFNFYNNFLNLLDEKFLEKKIDAPFCFNSLIDLIVFPDGFEECFYYIDREIKKPNVPLLLSKFKPIGEGDDLRFIAQEVSELPNLPLNSGFIAGFDSNTGLPTEVSDKPHNDFFGAFYWVKSKGVRRYVREIGVIDPLECLNGCSLWWSPNDASPIIGVRVVRKHTDEIEESFKETKKKIYDSFLEKFHSKKWSDKSKSFE